jgi:hypothetical protein
VKNPNTALETTVEEWIDAYQGQQEEESSAGHEGEALAELINFVFRVCARKNFRLQITSDSWFIGDRLRGATRVSIATKYRT